MYSDTSRYLLLMVRQYIGGVRGIRKIDIAHRISSGLNILLLTDYPENNKTPITPKAEN